MAQEHLSVTDSSLHYLETQRRYNYVTPKSFLELIGFYKYILGSKRKNIQRLVDRLDVGLNTLARTSQDVAELQVALSEIGASVRAQRFRLFVLAIFV